MRILLTGGSGMLGHNIREHPRARDHELLVPSRSEVDLCVYPEVESYLRENCPDLIIHAAGRVGGIAANMREPVRFLIENFDMGKNLIVAARAAGVRRLINVGSSCMYPRDMNEPLREELVLGGKLEPTNEGYALAKISVARLCDYVTRETPECAYKTVIPCNLYGRYDKFDPAWSHLVPAILHKLHKAKTTGTSTVEIWGDGAARREFMYAGDCADAILEAVARFTALPEVMNIGVGKDYSVNEYYADAAEVVGFTGRFVHDLSKPVGMARKLTSIERLREWGWSARTSLREGLKRTYDYYLEKIAVRK